MKIEKTEKAVNEYTKGKSQKRKPERITISKRERTQEELKNVQRNGKEDRSYAKLKSSEWKKREAFEKIKRVRCSDRISILASQFS